MSSAMPMVTGEQPSHQATTDPFPELLRSSTIVPSDEQSLEQTTTPGGMSYVPRAMPERTCEQSQYPAASKSFTEQPPISSSATTSDDQPTDSARKVSSMESVSVRKKGIYEAHDKVDQYLLLQVSRHVQADTLELLAAHLGVSEECYVDTRTTGMQHINPRVQAWKVCRDTGMDFTSLFFFSFYHHILISTQSDISAT